MTKATIITGTMILAALLIGIMLATETNPSTASAGNLSWKSFDEAVTLAKQENKKILIDVYTDWCSWCKKMDSEVYANGTVIEALSASFIPVKLNAESSERSITFQGRTLTEEQFASSAGVTGYPTTIFLDASAAPITLLPGYVPADRFVPILKYIGDNHYQNISFEEYQKKNNRTPQ